MRGCNRCAELEAWLEKVALSHLDALQVRDNTLDSDLQKQWTEQAFHTSRTALDVAQKLYNKHVELAHPKHQKAESTS